MRNSNVETQNLALERNRDVETQNFASLQNNKSNFAPVAQMDRAQVS